MTAAPQERKPAVSVIVPARNEEACLGACLESLAGQQGVDFEIVVVDDGSSDRTRAIAQSFSGVQVLEADPLPAGWGGKSNALVTGARQARGEWLLFTDADTVHLPGSLARSLAEVQQHAAALLSYSPAQEVRGFWEQAVMPLVFYELARTYPPAKVNDPASPVAAANGQYLLVERRAYDAVGGHAAVAQTLLEDMALAKAFKRAGYRLRFRFGGDAVRTRMYRSFRQMYEGWTKNLALLFPAVRLAVWYGLEFLGIAAGLALAGWAGFHGQTKLAALAAAAASMGWLNLLRRVRKAHFGWGTSLAAVAGLPVFALLLLRSALYTRWRGKVVWKGRTYASRPDSPRDGKLPQAAPGA
ncbi:MAG TPA: glycosyltransferase family 2 protein [Terriglobales bacterium]|jgi:glycosyltransferase involved in cell wall biosynthesis|nr:glycosyltransferase family 2 protein [Terriglobales bacterium]